MNPNSPHAMRVKPDMADEDAHDGADQNRRDFSVVGGKKGAGRPRKYLTDQQIEDLERLAETGATRDEQAAFLGIDADTLSKRIRDQPAVYFALARAGARLRVSLRRKQVAIALNDRHPAQGTMLVWLGKALLGQTEKLTLKIETAREALDRLKSIWPDIDEDQMIRQLTAGDPPIDVEALEVEPRE